MARAGTPARAIDRLPKSTAFPFPSESRPVPLLRRLAWRDLPHPARGGPGVVRSRARLDPGPTFVPSGDRPRPSGHPETVRVQSGAMLMSVPVDGGVASSQNPPAKPNVSRTRNAIGVIFLLAFWAAAFVEWNARRQASAACETLEQALAEHKGKPPISRAEAESLIGRPSNDSGANRPMLYRINYIWQ